MFLELERAPVVDVVADVLLVREHFAHGSSRPFAAEVGEDVLVVEAFGDFGFRQVVIDEPAIDLIDDGDLVVGTGLQDDPVGLQTLVLAARQFALDRPRLIDQHPP